MEPRELRCPHCIGGRLVIKRSYGDPHFECLVCRACFEVVLTPGLMFKSGGA